MWKKKPSLNRQVRAEGMQRASEEQASSMATVFTSPTSRLDLAFETSKVRIGSVIGPSLGGKR